MNLVGLNGDWHFNLFLISVKVEGSGQGVCRVRPRGMLGGFDTNVTICELKPKNFVRYEHKFLWRLLVMTDLFDINTDQVLIVI